MAWQVLALEIVSVMETGISGSSQLLSLLDLETNLDWKPEWHTGSGKSMIILREN